MNLFFDEDHIQDRNTRLLTLNIEGQQLSLLDAIDGLERVLARLRAEAGSLEEEFDYRFAGLANASFTYPYERYFHITGFPSRQFRYAPPDEHGKF